MKIDLNTAASILLDLKGAEFFGLEINTDPRMKKTDNPFIQDGIRKISRMNVQITDYEASVNKQREREGKEEDFVAGESYHEPIMINGKLTAFARKTDGSKYYLRYRPLNCLETKFVNRYNAEVPEALLRNWLPKKTVSQKQNLDKEIPFRLTELANIRKLIVRGREYEIIPAE